MLCFATGTFAGTVRGQSLANQIEKICFPFNFSMSLALFPGRGRPSPTEWAGSVGGEEQHPADIAESHAQCVPVKLCDGSCHISNDVF